MRIVIRTDASFQIGTGHVMRCLTLAAALREQGATISFICRAHQGHLGNLIADRGFALDLLPAGLGYEPGADEPAHAGWLGTDWQADARQTVDVLVRRGGPADWLIVDHYALDRRWEERMRVAVRRIMAVDDLADRLHDCDILLDQNLIDGMATRYASLLPHACRPLLGPKYALLQPAYAQLHAKAVPRKGPVRRAFVFVGGADNANLTGRIVSALLGAGGDGIAADVVISASSPQAVQLREMTAGHPNIHLHSGLPTLAHLMAAADLAIGAGGATTWERLCLGLPSIVITLADNQVPVAHALHARGLIEWLGDVKDVSEERIGVAVARRLQDGIPAGWWSNMDEPIDGKGAARVCEALVESYEERAET